MVRHGTPLMVWISCGAAFGKGEPGVPLVWAWAKPMVPSTMRPVLAMSVSAFTVTSSVRETWPLSAGRMFNASGEDYFLSGRF
jgi:hypothetical protein